MPCPPIESDGSRHVRSLSGWTLLAAVLSFAVLATPFFLGRVYVADDLGEFHLPARNFYSDQLARGESFDWMPGLFGGFYITGEGQLGAYHPLHWLLYRWLPLGAAFDLELLVNYPCLFAGTYVFLRRWKLAADAALFGALVFTFGGFNLLHFVHPNAVAIVAHLPWLLWAVDVALSDDCRRRRTLATLAAGLLVASELLLGYPQYVWLSMLMVAAYAIWRARALQAPWTRGAWLMALAVLGVMTAGVQLWPTYDLLGDSVRRAPDAAFANTGSMHPLNLVQCLAPYLFQSRVVGQNTHELGIYLGAVPALLCLWLLTQRRHWGAWAPLVWASIAFCVFAVFTSMGEFAAIYRVQQWLPVVNRFRFPCRAIVLVQACMATLAAVAMAVLVSKARSGVASEPARGALIAAVAASVLLAVAGPWMWGEFVADPVLVWTGPLLVTAGACLIAQAERGARGALAALVVFTAVDLVTYGATYSIYGRTAELHEFVARIPRPPRDADLRIAMPDDSAGRRSGDRMLLAGLSRIDGYAGLEPARQLDYSSQRALQLAGVGWVLRADYGDKPTRYDWIAVPDSAPRVRLMAESAAARRDAATSAGSARAMVDRPGHLVVEAHASGNAVLATTESYHHGWRATVDGRPVAIVRVNHDFLGCELEAGEHRVELIFRPDSLRLGKVMATSGLGLIVCAALARFLFRSLDAR